MAIGSRQYAISSLWNKGPKIHYYKTMHEAPVSQVIRYLCPHCHDRLLCRRFPVKVAASALIGMFSFIIDMVARLNKAEAYRLAA
jgi:hypothetical protein